MGYALPDVGSLEMPISRVLPTGRRTVLVARIGLDTRQGRIRIIQGLFSAYASNERMPKLQRRREPRLWQGKLQITMFVSCPVIRCNRGIEKTQSSLALLQTSQLVGRTRTREPGHGASKG